MPDKPAIDVKLVRREEKQAQLVSFIARHLTSESHQHGATDVSIVARSVDSPVVKALVSVLSESHDSFGGVSVRTILTTGEGTNANRQMAVLGDLRFIQHAGLSEAHEQIAIGSAALWVGDAMRRDPDKLDSFERIVEADVEPVTWSHVAFRRLWAICAPTAARSDSVCDIADFDPALAERMSILGTPLVRIDN